jgi:hypothetical protein
MVAADYFDKKAQAKAKLAQLKEIVRECEKAETEVSLKVAKFIEKVRSKYARQDERLTRLCEYRNFALNKLSSVAVKLVDNAAIDTLSPLRLEKYFKFAEDGTPCGCQLAVEPKSESLQEDLEDVDNSVKDWADKEKELPAKAVIIHRQIQIMMPGPAKKKAMVLSLPGVTSEDIIDEEIAKFAAMGVPAGMIAGSFLKTSPSDSGSSNFRDSVEEHKLRLNDPNHENKLRAIRAQGMLNELLTTDDIIKSYAPDEVALVFNELARTAPNTLSNMGLLRANLRRGLQGNLSPFEAKELVTMDRLAGKSPSAPSN